MTISKIAGISALTGLSSGDGISPERGISQVGAAPPPSPPTSAEIAQLFTENSWAGDFWDTTSIESMGGALDGIRVGSIAGYRGSIALIGGVAVGTIPPYFSLANGTLHFPDAAIEHTIDPQSSLGQLGDAFYVCARGIWLDGFFRIVCVDSNDPHPVLFDIRVGEAGAVNPGGLSALVQDQQVNIANISGITVPTMGDVFVVSMSRTAGGNGTLKIGAQTGTVTKGAASASAVANTRYAENYNVSGDDFHLGRSVFIKGDTPSAGEESTIEAWVGAAYTAPSAASGFGVFGAKGADITLSNGNLTASSTTLAWESTGLSASAKTTGKHSVVFNIAAGAVWGVGVGNSSFNAGSFAGSDGNSVGYISDGNKYAGGSASAFGAAYNIGSKVKIEIDCGAATAQFFLFLNGAWAAQGTMDISSLGSGVFPIASLYSYGPIASQSINSGQFPFAVSSGVTMGWTA